MSEWVIYDGTNRPKIGRCYVRTRNFDESTTSLPAWHWRWTIDGSDSDIIAYKMAEEYTDSRIDVIGQNGNTGEHYNTAPSLLQEAAKIMEERGKQYDQPGGERSMAKTVTMFNAATGRDITEVEGWFFMECLKNVRFFQNTAKPHEDSVKDKIAYAALFGEAALMRLGGAERIDDDFC